MNERVQKRRPIRTWRWLALLLLVANPLTAGAADPASGASPAVGRAQVVTQGAVELPGPSVVWRLVSRIAKPRGEAVPGTRVLGFVVPVEGPVLLTNVTAGGEEDVARVAPGEFYLVREGTRQIRASMSGAPVKYLTLELVPADLATDVGAGSLIAKSDPLAAPAGERDFDLVANNLRAGDQGTVPDSGEPILICVTSGTIEIHPQQGEATTITLGQFALFENPGELTIAPASTSANQNAKAIPEVWQDAQNPAAATTVAGYVAAVFGPEIPSAP
jgi:hypothetical protein